MTISLKHTFQSAKPDSADTSLVQPSNWNAEHTMTAAAGTVIGRDTSGAGAIQELPIAVDNTGKVGIGGNPTTAQLAVAGVIESTTGGIKFPDATTQTTAVSIPSPGASGNLLTSDGTNWTSAAAPIGWTQITQITTTSGSTATFSNIPQTYSEILFVLENVSHNSGTSTSFGIELSANGTTWSSRSNITSATSSTSNAYGALHIPRYTGNAGSMVNGVALGLTAPAQSPTGLTTAFVFAWVVAGIAHARFSPGGGSFDGGTITLLGRK